MKFQFQFHLGVGSLARGRRGDEEHELAVRDGWREAGRVVDVGLEQRQPLGRRVTGDQTPQQPRFPLVP
jgi:hypothetical protein